MKKENVTEKQMVSKRNDMIQRSRFSLGLIEFKALSYIISKVRPGDEPGKTYVFNCNEFHQVTQSARESYTELKNMLLNISNTGWWIVRPDGKEAIVRWFNTVHMTPGSGLIEIKFHEDMFPYILDLQRQRENNIFFTSYQLRNIALMKHQYSPRIYEILKSYQYNNKEWSFEIGTGTERDFQVLIASSVQDKKTKEMRPQVPASWKNFAVFERDVLQHAKNEINTLTDLDIDYQCSKIGLDGEKRRKVCSIKFFLSKKKNGSDNENIAETEQHNAETCVTLKSLSRDEIIENSPCPVFMECFLGEYDEEKVTALYSEAQKHMASHAVRPSAKELWVTDYVSYYNDIVKATPDQTKTTTYQRLYDMVRKDYDGIGSQMCMYDA